MLKPFAYISFICLLLGAALSGCQKLEEIEPCEAGAPVDGTSMRRAPGTDIFEVSAPDNARSDEVVPIDDNDNDNVNDDDDNEDGDEIQGSAKRAQ